MKNHIKKNKIGGLTAFLNSITTKGWWLKPQILVTAALLLAALPDTAKAQGNLVFNGGFDTSADGWSSGHVTTGFRSTKGNPGGMFCIEGTLGANPVPTVTQKISGLTAGNTYLISGDFELQFGDWRDVGFGVAVNNNYLFESSALGWTPFSFLYTATAAGMALSFSSELNNTATGYAIDNISVKAVPEPGTLSLVALGTLAGAAITMRSRNKKKGV